MQDHAVSGGSTNGGNWSKWHIAVASVGLGLTLTAAVGGYWFWVSRRKRSVELINDNSSTASQDVVTDSVPISPPVEVIYI